MTPEERARKLLAEARLHVVEAFEALGATYDKSNADVCHTMYELALAEIEGAAAKAWLQGVKESGR